jgi:pentapeptide MXKDX repeat protein
MEFTLVESKKKSKYGKTTHTTRDTMTRDTMTRDTMTRDTMTRDTMTRDTMSRDTMTQSPILKDTMTQEPMPREPFQEKKILTQEEMTEVLISKIKSLDNIEIKTKEINKEKGKFFAINVRVDLSKIGNGVFHSAKLNTVSHINRVVNMKLVFSDNENLHHDMRVNIDSIIQCFREVAPDTITSIHIETFKDQIDNEHLSLTITTIKGSSLIYVYKRMMDFVSIINEKYGVLPPSNYKPVSINDIAEEMTDKIINENRSNEPIKTIDPIIKTEVILDTKIETVTEVKEVVIVTEVNDNKTIIHNSILSVIENLEKEEKRLVLELENIRKLIKSQNSILEISSIHPKMAQVTTTIEKKENKETIDIKQNVSIDKNSFASKVKSNL